ncbi:MAG: hypothetical protein AB7O26_06145 [Planctomycetaceae bacterium]
MSMEFHTSSLHPEIAALLERLRGRIRRYVLAEGAALVVVVMAVLFWLSLGVDWLYFSVRTLELPVWFRKGFLIVAACAFASSVGVWVLLRTFRRARAKALALVLERRFPELNDRLITAVELAESKTGGESDLTLSMLHRTIDDVVEATRRIEVDEVFNRAPLRRAAIAAIVLIVSIGAFAAMNNAAFARWQRAFINWDDEYWERRTELVIRVIAEPGDRVCDFQDAEYRHPRGADLNLLIEVPEGREVPDRVQLYYELDRNHGHARVPLSRFGDRQFRHTITGLLDGLVLYVRGGDFTNRRPLRVNVVEPPRIDNVVLSADYPDYTGLDPVKDAEGVFPRQSVLVQGTQASLPMGTDFILQAATNKPMQSVRIQTDRLDMMMTPEGGTLTVLAAEGVPERSIRLEVSAESSFLSTGGDEFRVPFAMFPDAAKRLTDPQLKPPFPLTADETLRITLHDSDDIISAEPSRLTLNVTIDQPPVIQTELQGVGTSITRKAVIPMKGVVTDDYGVAKSRFDFRVNAEDQWRVRPFRSPPEGSPKSFTLKRGEGSEFEQFEVLPLDLAIGHKLTLTVAAQDGDNLTGPHTSRGEQYTFQIVSDEELLSLLYARELNLRRRFEQIITEIEQTQKDLILHRTRVEEGRKLKGSPAEPGTEKDRDMQIRELDTAVAVCAERSLHQIRKNAGENAAIEDSFKAILEELVNNSVHTRQMVDRIEGLIVRPLNSINQSDFPSADQTLGLFKLANEKGDNPIPRIDASAEALGTMLAHMRAVLAEMEDLVKFHEAVQRLKRIIDDEEKIEEDTQDLRKKSRLKELKELQ